jgi:hypothetical protein
MRGFHDLREKLCSMFKLLEWRLISITSLIPQFKSVNAVFCHCRLTGVVQMDVSVGLSEPHLN